MKYVHAVLCGLSFALSGLAVHADEAPTTRVALHIEPQPVRAALKTFSDQTGVQVLLRVDNISLDRIMAPRINGELTVPAALDRLLRNSGLKYEFVNEHTVRISAAVEAPPTSASHAPSSAVSATTSGEDPIVMEVPSHGNRSTSSSGPSPPSEPKLEEILVTAQKKTERLQDVPVPVTALDPETLAQDNQVRLQDYFSAVPGLNLFTTGSGQQSLAIRGITTGANYNPTVGVTIDDVPYGSSTFLGFGGQLYPDIDPSDLTQIEVLRGPQGTLYGANSMGGLIKFVTTDPSTAGISGRIQVLGDAIEHGDPGYGVRGAINVPLSDDFAIRVSGFSRRDAGYIENVTTGERAINSTDVYGGRIAALWRPSDFVSVKLAALAQHTEANGSSIIDSNVASQPILGDLQQTGLPNTGQYNSDARLYSATVNATFAGLDFVSISGYGINKYYSVGDFTESLGGGTNSYSYQNFLVTGATGVNDFETKKFSQEFRLSSAKDQRLEWVVGAYYTHESTLVDGPTQANDFATGAPVGTLVLYDESSAVSELAAFGDLTVHLTDRFDVQFGGRESQYRQIYNETDVGPLVPAFGEGPSPYVQPTEHTKGNAFTYLATPRFRISPDLMLYVRIASGYRLGGPNIESQLDHTPPSYGPDKTNNYELGIKGNMLNHALNFDASVYYINWKDIQLQGFEPAYFTYFFENGGGAKSKGLELSIEARPFDGTLVSLAASLNDATLSQNLPESTAVAPAVYGLSGDRLPYSSRFSGSISLQQDVGHFGPANGFAGGSLSYVGMREGDFAYTVTPPTPQPPRQEFPGFAQFNLHAGVRYESWLFNLFLNNASDKRGIVGGGPYYGVGSAGYYATVIQPRTVGLAISRTF